MEPNKTQMTNYSNSYLQRFRECPLACYYHNELRLRKREDGGESHHTVYSRAFHEGLRLIHLDEPLRTAQEAFLAGYPRQLDESDLAKTRQNGVTALAQYAGRWREEDKRYKVLSVETLDQQEDGFVVKLDLVVEDLATGQIYGMDHKTTKKYLNYDYWAGFEPNSQIVEYVRYIKERWGFCDGFIIDAISFRWLAEKDKRGGFNGQWLDVDNAEQYGYSHHERRFSKYHKREMLACWGLRTSFERQTFNVNGRQMEADLDSRRYWTDRVEHAKATGVWGMNTSQCKFCEYRDLCKAGWFYPDDAELIELNYRRICGRWFGEPLAPCQLDREHEGEHALQSPEFAPTEITIEA
jgi:hypothetical protein